MASVADDPGPGRPPPVMLLGPTASGKSAVAMALAGRLPVDIEIVSVDSAQVYRGMDIGTAKPDAAERARVPHHLIDIVDPQDSYSAARFADDARAAVRAVQARGRLPLLVGGTMLYARAFTHGLHALPPADARLRASLLEEAGRLGWPAMHARLATLDPATAARLAPHDAQRIERALEICVLTGEPMSALLRRPAAGGWPGPLLTLVLEPADRAALHARIGARFEAMIAAGLVGEVEALRARPGMHAGLPSMRSVGYRQVWEWLDAGAREPVSALVAAGATATRRLAKRQLTWLRSMSGVVRVDSESTDRTDRIADAILAALGR